MKLFSLLHLASVHGCLFHNFAFKNHSISFSASKTFTVCKNKTKKSQLVLRRMTSIAVAAAFSQSRTSPCLWLVIHLEEDSQEGLFVRIISARKATPGERRDYEQNRKNDF